jgi:hypothetical protein
LRLPLPVLGLICLHTLFHSSHRRFLRRQRFSQSQPAVSSGRQISGEETELNENTVVIVSVQTPGTYLKLAEDLQNVLERRTPMGCASGPLSAAGAADILDVLLLRGVDMCMTETDYSDYLKGFDADFYGDIGSKINYIAKL